MPRYVPSGRMEAGAFPVMVLGAVGAGALTGGLLHFVGQWIRLLILFPLAMGFAVGVVLSLSIDSRKVRAPLLVALIGLAGGAVAWSSDFLLGFRAARANHQASLEELFEKEKIPAVDGAARRISDWSIVRQREGAEISDDEFAATVQGAPVTTDDGAQVAPLSEVPLGTVLAAWVEVRAEAGTSISRSTGGDTNLGQTGTYVLWLLELLLAAGMAAFIAAARAKEAFCERCGQWFPAASIDVPIGPARVEPELIAATEAGDLGRVASLVERTEEKKRVMLKLAPCARCSAHHASIHRLQIAKNGGANVKAVYSGIVEGEGVPALIDEANRRLGAS